MAPGKVGKRRAKAWRGHHKTGGQPNLNRTLVQNRKENALKTKTTVHAGNAAYLIPDG